jgi:putative DNA primase/helicase
MAGEMAASMGVVPWSSGQALEAAKHGFSLWRDHRATGGRSAEDAAILRAVADFIDKHGDSRFSNLSPTLNDSSRPVLNRVGYVDWAGNVPIYLFTSGGLKEAVKTFGIKRAIAALDKAGAFQKKGENSISISTRTPDGRTPRLYHVNPEKLGDVGDQ